MVPTPTRPANTTSSITTMPVVWISSAGMNSKIASVWSSIGPWAVYMKAAKKTASARATITAKTGWVARSRAMRVRS